MITSSTWGRRALFSREVWAKLLIDALYHYRETAYLLHEFVVMPDHFHVLLTPKTSLEKAVQFIKGGFSYRAKKELGSNMEIWQKGFSDHRIRDASDYRLHQVYIRQNPVRKRLCDRAEEYPYSSAHSGFVLDPAPQGLKPFDLGDDGAARLEGAPFQSNGSKRESAGMEQNPITLSQGLKPFGLGDDGAARLEGAPFQSNTNTAVEGAAFQSNRNTAIGGVSFQSKFTTRPSEAVARYTKNKSA